MFSHNLISHDLIHGCLTLLDLKNFRELLDKTFPVDILGLEGFRFPVGFLGGGTVYEIVSAGVAGVYKLLSARFSQAFQI